jgi:hypothetical protein
LSGARVGKRYRQGGEFAAFAAIVIALYMTGANVYGYFADGPGTPVDQSQAAVAKRARCLASPRSDRGAA